MHLVSDATGETVISSARACAAQFDGVRPIEHFWNLVRTQRQLILLSKVSVRSRDRHLHTRRSRIARETREYVPNTAGAMRTDARPDPEGPVSLSRIGE